MIHIHRFLNRSSGGAVAAVAIAMLSRERLLAFTEEYAVRGRAMEGILRALGVSARSLSDVGGGSQPADQPCSAAERLSGRVFIGATECTSGRPALFSRFASNEQLARCLVASCTIPPSARPTPTSPFRLMTACTSTSPVPPPPGAPLRPPPLGANLPRSSRRHAAAAVRVGRRRGEASCRLLGRRRGGLRRRRSLSGGALAAAASLRRTSHHHLASLRAARSLVAPRRPWGRRRRRRRRQ